MNLPFNFARLEKGDWVVEVTGVPDENGDFEYITNWADGVIASGRLTFDTDGNFSGSTLSRLTLNWANDGSAPSEL